MSILDAIVLGIVEGLTEFLPVSSTGHLTIAEKLLGKDIDAKSVTAFTAVIQVGAIVAVQIYFREDIMKLLRAVFGGFRNEQRRKSDPNWRFAWLIVIGSIPIGIVGLAAKGFLRGPFPQLGGGGPVRRPGGGGPRVGGGGGRVGLRRGGGASGPGRARARPARRDRDRPR